MSDQSQAQNSLIGDTEIDLSDFVEILWRGKFFIMLCIVVAVVLAALYLRSAERKYTVTYVVVPVSSSETVPNLGGFGGLASLAGVAIKSNSNSDFLTFKYLLKSEEVASVILKNLDLVREIFPQEWDVEKDTFRKPPDLRYTFYFKALRQLFTGQAPPQYISPNAARLSDWMNKAFSETLDRETGFLTLSAETSKPELLINLMALVIQQTDNILKERYTATAEKTMMFYQQQLAKARAREHREALARLITEEDQKLMLASKGSFFIAEPLTNPSTSIYPTSPKASLVLALSVVLGGFIGAGLILIIKTRRS